MIALILRISPAPIINQLLPRIGRFVSTSLRWFNPLIERIIFMNTIQIKLFLLLLPCVLAACALEFKNAQPAHELVRLSQSPGSVPLGWRVFQDRCASCHGPAALGTANAPNLLPLVRDMDLQRFSSRVLQRYDWGLPAEKMTEQSQTSPAQQASADELAPRKQPALEMPAWQGEPRVTTHISDVYAYLSARAQGVQGTGRPVQ